MSSEFTCGDRDLAVYLTHSHPTFCFLAGVQSTSDVDQTREIQLFGLNLEQDKEI